MSTPLVRRLASLAAAALVTALVLPVAPASGDPASPTPPAAPTQPDSPLPQELVAHDGALPAPDPDARVRVIVTLAEQPESPSQAQETANLATQGDLITAWGQKHGLSVDSQFGYLINGFSAEIPASAIPALAAEPEVASVKRERVYYATEHTAREHHGVPAAYAAHGADGTGTVISIIDSGIDPSHPDLRLDDCGAAKISAINPEGGLFTCKVPNGYNYADESFEIRDLTSSQHGQHVAGIAAANGSQGTESEFETTGRVDGAAPNAQLLAMKVFSNKAGRSRTANDADIVAAIEDSVKLGADVINMSLGSTNGIPDASSGAYQAITRAREAGVLTVVAAGNEGQNYSPTGLDTDALGLLDDGTLNDPAAQAPALAVASLDNSTMTTAVGHLGEGASQTEFTYLLATGNIDDDAHRLVDVGLGSSGNYPEGEDLTGAYVLVERGEFAFAEKFRNAVDHGAAGILVFNSEVGSHTSMGGVQDFTILGVGLTRSDGLALRAALESNPDLTVRLTSTPRIAQSPEGVRHSAFSSWGTTPSLDFKPEISGIGGSVYSTVGANSYASNSGTSMAAPNIAGLGALMHQALSQRHPDMTPTERLDLSTALLMNTALIPTYDNGIPLLPRQVGAGLARVDEALASPVSATVEGRAAAALRQITGPTTFTVTLTNHSEADAVYTVPAQQVLTETNAAWRTTLPVVSSETLTASAESVTVPAGGTAEVAFTLTPQVDTNHFIEGWVRLRSAGEHPDLALPYLGFAGDWNAEPIIQEPGRPWADNTHRDVTALEGSLDRWLWDIGDLPTSVYMTYLAMSPNGDRYLDRVFPSMLLMRNADEVHYEILDASGATLVDLGTDENLSRLTGVDIARTPFRHPIVHTGRSFDGRIWDPAAGSYTTIPDGTYTYRISARLGDDFPWQTTDFPLRIDSTAPVITVLEQSKDSVRFSVTEEGSGLLGDPKVRTADGTGVQVTAVGDSTYRATFNPSTPFVHIKVEDLGLNTVSRYVVPGDPDHADIYLTLNHDLVTDSFVPDRAFPFVDMRGYVTGRAERLTVNGTEVPLSGQDFDFRLGIEDKPSELVLRAYAADGSLLKEQTVALTYDLEDPVIAVTGGDIANGELVVKNDGSATISGTVIDDRATAPELSLTIESDQVALAKDGSFTHTLTDIHPSTTRISLSARENKGSSILTLPIQGRQKPPEAPRTELSLDLACSTTIAEICTITRSSPNLSEDGSTVTLQGRLTPGDGASIELVRSSRAQDGTITANEPIAAPVGQDGAFSTPLPVSPGRNDYTLIARDAQGRAVIEQRLYLFLDTAAPSIDIAEPGLIGGTLYTNKDEVTFRGSISDDGWGHYLALNNAVASDIIRLENPGPQANTRTFEKILAVRDGDVIRVYSTDRAGNSLIGLIPVTVDKSAPSAGVDTVGNGEIIRDGRSLNAWAEDENLASMRVSLNGKVVEDKRTALTSEQMEVEDALQPPGDLDRGPAPGSQAEGVQSGEQSAAGEAAQDGQEAPAAQDAPADPATTETTEAEGSQPSEPSIDAYGSRTTTTQTRLEAAVETADLTAGHYTLTVESTDLAGNTTTEIRCFVVDDAAVITGPDTVQLTVAPGDLGDQEAVAAKVLALYSVTDDGAAGTPGDTSLSLLPGTVLVDGTNTVRIVATDAAGYQVSRSVEVTITISAPGGGSGGSDGTGTPSAPGTPAPGTDSTGSTAGAGSAAGQDGAGDAQAPRAPAQPGERPVDPLPAGTVDDVRSRWEAASQGTSHVKSARAEGALPATGSGALGLMLLSLMALTAGGVVIRLRRRRG
ncbi:S8 family serine peptidase [Actinomyces capricornis]|uniref:Subtilisin-like serine protease n=1 Tax=Actinomyces capricornis TaxID=2755559 RepID=A0ABM7U9N5_9ACTO|nr:S8 family serine peptidase [Actinomyces capricornis]BDA64115.1 subtilisin-like serine protease [Actinomyces capricornis]